MSLSSTLCRIATSIILLIVCAMPCVAASAKQVGHITHTSGPLFAKKANGSMKSLAINSPVEEGDTLVTEKRTYGRVKFNDGGEVTLRPGSSFVVESFLYDKEKPASDNAVFSLVKGSLRAVTGQVGKRGNLAAYKMKAPTATIGIRGTAYDLKVCQDNCPGLANGIYFYVIEGMIEVSNAGGSVSYGAGQYGYVKDVNSKPELLINKPDLGFEPPPPEQSACGVR